MRRVWPLVFLLGCGPSVGEPDDGAASGASSSTTESMADGSSTNPPTTTTTSTTSTSMDSSTTAPPLNDEDVLGIWLCEVEDYPFTMTIEDYMSPTSLTGLACVDWNEAEDPREWQPCGELSSHPTTSGLPWLSIFAVVVEDTMTWAVSADLFYDPATDTMTGNWHAIDGGTGGANVDCVRLE